MGVVPVATRERYGERPGAIFPWAEDALGDTELPEVLDPTELDFEKIAALVERVEQSEEFGVSISDERFDVVDAAQEGRDILLDPEHEAYDAVNFSSVLSLPYALERLVPAFTAAVDGDPETTVEEAA